MKKNDTNQSVCSLFPSLSLLSCLLSFLSCLPPLFPLLSLACPRSFWPAFLSHLSLPTLSFSYKHSPTLSLSLLISLYLALFQSATSPFLCYFVLLLASFQYLSETFYKWILLNPSNWGMIKLKLINYFWQHFLFSFL